ncbi:hypothetical protein, partial [Rhodococcus sp. 05-2255-1e]|uniref:hypothetical protein n=2 Tax=Rhodococcus TaxID=1827 RepID=UPI00211B06CC
RGAMWDLGCARQRAPVSRTFSQLRVAKLIEALVMSIGDVSADALAGVPSMNKNLLNDHQIITELIGNAAQLPAEDPRAARWATEALALASAAELPLLIEEAEGVLGRIEHDTTCRWCAGQPGAAIPVGSFWCIH